MGKLDDKIAIITGASGGIGSAAAALFSREGAKLVITGRDEARLSEAARACDPERTRCVVADNRDPASVARVVETAVSEFGGVDVVFANAAHEGVIKPFVEQTLENFDELWQANVRGPVALLQAALPHMIARKGGSVVITGSVITHVGVPGATPYATTKTALLGLVRTLGLELGSLGIRVNLLVPGGTDNRMLDVFLANLAGEHAAAAKQASHDGMPLRRLATNEDIAKAALFLASDDSSYCTASELLVDGGFSAS